MIAWDDASLSRARNDPGGHSGVVIGRYLGTVVVTVHGGLGVTSVAHLGLVLADLIDGQGNLSVIVDLYDATVTDDECATVFADAAVRARRHGGVITLSAPPALVDEALRRRGSLISRSGAARRGGLTRRCAPGGSHP